MSDAPWDDTPYDRERDAFTKASQPRIGDSIRWHEDRVFVTNTNEQRSRLRRELYILGLVKNPDDVTMAMEDAIIKAVTGRAD